MGDNQLYTLTPIGKPSDLANAGKRPETEEMRKVISQQMMGKYVTLFLLISILATSGAVLTQAINASACFAMIGVTLAIIAGYLVTVHYDHLTIKTIMDTLRKINQKQVQSPEPSGEIVTEKSDEFVEKNLKNNKKFS